MAVQVVMSSFQQKRGLKTLNPQSRKVHRIPTARIIKAPPRMICNIIGKYPWGSLNPKA